MFFMSGAVPLARSAGGLMQTSYVRSIILAVGLTWCWGGGAAAADDHHLCPICSKANDDTASYVDRAGNTLARGALNMTLGWTELIRQPAKKVRKGGNVFVGIATGVGHSLVRTARGVGEVFTFWTPKNEHISDDCPIDTMQ